MPYRILKRERTDAALRRIVVEQVDRTLAEMTNEGLAVETKIHQARKRCKKIRAVVRLLRPEHEDLYRHENAWYRDAARSLSELRDQDALFETHKRLVSHPVCESVPRTVCCSAAEEFRGRRDHAAADTARLAATLDDFIEAMRQGRARAPDWTLAGAGFEMMTDGLRKTYRRGRKAISRSYEEGTPDAFHEWRKRVKYHWYHMRLLRGLWKPVMHAHCRQVHVLAGLLGDDHDLALYLQAMEAAPSAFGKQPYVKQLIRAAQQRRRQLEEAAHPLGLRVFAEKPPAFTRRMEAYWAAQRRKPGP